VSQEGFLFQNILVNFSSRIKCLLETKGREKRAILVASYFKIFLPSSPTNSTSHAVFKLQQTQLPCFVLSHVGRRRNTSSGAKNFTDPHPNAVDVDRYRRLGGGRCWPIGKDYDLLRLMQPASQALCCPLVRGGYKEAGRTEKLTSVDHNFVQTFSSE
jgi:hypothetical protein